MRVIKTEGLDELAEIFIFVFKCYARVNKRLQFVKFYHVEFICCAI